MISLFKTNLSIKGEIEIKDTLFKALQENVKEIQLMVKGSGENYLELNEATNSLCTTLEAIFLHGLKDSFIRQTFNVLSGDVHRRPHPNFWPPLLIFIHKQVIEQIHSNTQIVSEVGCCRAWIRISLNESLFSSYLNNIRKNSSALNPYYKKNAFLKDSDLTELATKLMEGVESCVQFILPLNSSLLNQWPSYSLQLAGVWTPPLKSCPIGKGVDVASSITEVSIPIPRPLQTNELFSDVITNSPFSRTSNFAVEDLTHKENLDLFLQKVDEMKKIDEEGDIASEAFAKNVSQITNLNSHSISSTNILESPVRALNYQDNDKNLNQGNSITNLMQISWSSDLAVSSSSSLTSARTPIERCSFNMLLKRHEDNMPADWKNIWEQFAELHGNEKKEKRITSFSDDESIVSANYEEIVQLVSNKFSIDELQEMVETLCKLAREPGLDTQGFLCKFCAHPLGIGFAPAQICAFSGNYFCASCMNAQRFAIPAKIIYNWDFGRYPVSKRVSKFLDEFQSQPFIDLELLNPGIYNASEQMAELQSLRIRLNFMRAYLYTCCPSVIEELMKLVLMKDYLFEYIHKYSIRDLILIQRGSLVNQLQKAVSFGEGHILQCLLCSVKGFICEICNNHKVLYPFHIKTTYRCEACGAVFHATCLNKQEPCPKCERRKKRQDLPLFQAIQNMT